MSAEIASVAGLWVGVAGFFVGVIGVAVAIYPIFASKPDALHIASAGWLAALVIGLAAWFTTTRLLRYLKERDDELKKFFEEHGAKLQQSAHDLTRLQIDHQRLLIISEFIAARTTRTATRRSVPPTRESQGAEIVNPI